MINKNKLFLLLTLATLNTFCFTPKDMEQFPTSVREIIKIYVGFGGPKDIEEMMAFCEFMKLKNFSWDFFSCEVDYDKEKFKKFLAESKYVFDLIKLPQEIKNDFVSLLVFEKPGVLTLFSPQGETLFNFLKTMLSSECKIDDFRCRYINKLIYGVNHKYPHQDFELLAEIIEFGTKNGIKFEQIKPLILNHLLLKDLPIETASRIVSCLAHLVNSKDNWGYTPLMNACYKNQHLDLVKLLIKHLTDLEIKSIKSTGIYQNIPKGATALQIAAALSPELVTLLLENGADYNVETDNNVKVHDLIDAKTFENFSKKQEQIINSALHNELPQVLVDLICQYLKEKVKS